MKAFWQQDTKPDATMKKKKLYHRNYDGTNIRSKRKIEIQSLLCDEVLTPRVRRLVCAACGQLT